METSVANEIIPANLLNFTELRLTNLGQEQIPRNDGKLPSV